MSRAATKKQGTGARKRRGKPNGGPSRVFKDNSMAMELFGPHHANLTLIEKQLGVEIHAAGNRVSVAGEPVAAANACLALDSLYGRLQKGYGVDLDDVAAAVRMIAAPSSDLDADALTVDTRNRRISPRSPNQAIYMKTIDESVLVFGQGPAGTGKTYLAVAKAVEQLVRGDVDRIILSRPAVEAGEQLGFLPGDMREKIDPYLRPLYDALHDMLPVQQVAKRLESGEIEVAPLAFMRGRTLSNAFVILDEAQNTTAVQMKMLLTRLGENSRMVITGDLSQVDLPSGVRSGLRDALDVLRGTEGVGFVEFDDGDVVRHPMVARIVRAYGAAETRRKTGARYETNGVSNKDD